MTDYCRSAMSPFSTAAAANRRSYSCYNCNYSFYITLIPTTSDNSAPSPFRCPSCHHRHLIPHHTVSVPLYLPARSLSLPPPPPPPPLPPPPRSLDYQASDESEEEDYDSDNSLLSFSLPSFHSSSPASKSFVALLPIKYFALDLPPPLPSCSICLEDFDISPEGLVINELPCEHYFHKNCIVKWLHRSNTCPLCRYELPVDDSPEEGTATGSPEEGASTGTYFNWYDEDAVLVVDISWEDIFGSNAASPSGSDGFNSDGMPGEDGGRVSNAAASGSGGLAVNGREVSGLESDPMRDEDGDTFMVDA